MTDTEINIAIAEACGAKWYYPEDGSTGGIYIMLRPLADMIETVRPVHLSGMAIVTRIPDYCHDLNAMHEASIGLRASCRLTYAIYHRELERLVAISNNDDEKSICVADATASQRAEAFLRTLGKWKE